MIGDERHNKMAPWLEQVPNIYASGLGGLILYTELTEYFLFDAYFGQYLTLEYAMQNVLQVSATAMAAASVVELGNWTNIRKGICETNRESSY